MPTGHRRLVNTTLRQLALGLEATDVNGFWSRIYKFQLGGHGMGSACAMAMSGIDMALWDIRGKAVGWPSTGFWAGEPQGSAYAGHSLGIQPPRRWWRKPAFVASGYRR